MKISIITTVRNGARTIGECIASVKRQTLYAEHIIIDGLSSDGTIEIIKRQRSSDSIFVSEQDKGFYDAINKGLKLATGDVIGLLNADDVYVHDRVLERAAECFADPAVDSCYGDLVYVDSMETGKIRRYWRSGHYHKRRFFQGWMPPHPTFFVRREVYEKYGDFNLALGTAADYELMLRFLLKHEVTAHYIPEVLVKMRTGGQSNSSLKRRLAANRMDRKAWELNGLVPYPWTLLMKPLSKVGQYLNRGLTLTDADLRG
jgi:glycosyltransferase